MDEKKPKTAREHILEELHSNGKITQSQIMQISGLSNTSVNMAVKKLIEAHIIRHCGEIERDENENGVSIGGRRRIVYELVPEEDRVKDELDAIAREKNPLKDITRENLLLQLQEIIKNDGTRNEQRLKAMELQNKVLAEIIQGFDTSKPIFIVTSTRKPKFVEKIEYTKTG